MLSGITPAARIIFRSDYGTATASEEPDWQTQVRLPKYCQPCIRLLHYLPCDNKPANGHQMQVIQHAATQHD